ncbi:MAG: DNA recombination protein RmuC, partial [Blastocatellia bacterium]
YERLLEAIEKADAAGAEQAAKALEQRIRTEAKTMCLKYVNPPTTTDFAIMFLPIEGLYAEVLRRPGLAASIQRDHRVTVCGPTTLSAYLNALQMGFQTLAIEKRSSEVWKLLGQIKTEFGKYEGLLGKVQDRLTRASDAIGDVGVRTRAINRKLREVHAVEITHDSFLALPTPELEPDIEDEPSAPGVEGTSGAGA